MGQRMKAIVFEQAGQIDLQVFETTELEPGDILVKTLNSMVSSGTELRVLGGHYGAEDDFPLIPGYSSVGKVVAAVVEIGIGLQLHNHRWWLRPKSG